VDIQHVHQKVKYNDIHKADSGKSIIKRDTSIPCNAILEEYVTWIVSQDYLPKKYIETLTVKTRNEISSNSGVPVTRQTAYHLLDQSSVLATTACFVTKIYPLIIS
jgi:hypothetical protein